MTKQELTEKIAEINRKIKDTRIEATELANDAEKLIAKIDALAKPKAAQKSRVVK